MGRSMKISVQLFVSSGEFGVCISLDALNPIEGGSKNCMMLKFGSEMHIVFPITISKH